MYVIVTIPTSQTSYFLDDLEHMFYILSGEPAGGAAPPGVERDDTARQDGEGRIGDAYAMDWLAGATHGT